MILVLLLYRSLMVLFVVQKVPKKSIKILEQIDELFSMRFNYKNYRDALAQAHLPVVPYIGKSQSR